MNTKNNTLVLCVRNSKIPEENTNQANLYFKVREALKKVLSPLGEDIEFFREFDPGSGLTLAACITHSSRTEL